MSKQEREWYIQNMTKAARETEDLVTFFLAYKMLVESVEV